MPRSVWSRVMRCPAFPAACTSTHGRVGVRSRQASDTWEAGVGRGGCHTIDGVTDASSHDPFVVWDTNQRTTGWRRCARSDRMSAHEAPSGPVGRSARPAVIYLPAMANRVEVRRHGRVFNEMAEEYDRHRPAYP